MSTIEDGLARARHAGYRAVGLTGNEAACTRYANAIDAAIQSLRDDGWTVAPPTVHLDELIVFAPHERYYGRCDTCGEIRWETHFYAGGRGKPERKRHCACCTHRHNLPNGGHDERCLADESNCILLSGGRLATSVTYAGRQ